MILINIIKINGAVREAALPKQKAIPNSRKNIPIYIGFLVFVNIPSVIRWFYFSKYKVVLRRLNKSCVLPIKANPAKQKSTPAKLNGNGIMFNPGRNRKLIRMITRLNNIKTGGIISFFIIFLSDYYNMLLLK